MPAVIISDSEEEQAPRRKSARKDGKEGVPGSVVEVESSVRLLLKAFFRISESLKANLNIRASGLSRRP